MLTFIRISSHPQVLTLAFRQMNAIPPMSTNKPSNGRDRLASSEALRLLGGRIRIGELNYITNISLKNKYVYIEIAKSGCTFMKRWLGRIEFHGEGLGKNIPVVFDSSPHVNVIGTPFVKPFQLDVADFDNLFRNGSGFDVFTVVRNPYHRALSGFLDKVQYQTPECATLQRYTRKDIKDWSFEYYLDLVRIAIEEHPMDVDKHWRPQVWSIGSLHKLDVFKYIQLESTMELDSYLKWLGARCGLPANPDRDSQGSHQRNSKEKLSVHLTSKAAAQIQQIYAEDFRVFGYSHEIPSSE